MSDSVVLALIGFGATLEDDSVKAETKLHVLGTLNEVNLTLDELSESGVGRAVKSLKSAPGELGKKARLLVAKWKNLLRAHMAEASLTLPDGKASHEAANGPTLCTRSSTQFSPEGCDSPEVKKQRLSKKPQSPDLKLTAAPETQVSKPVVKPSHSSDPLPPCASKTSSPHSLPVPASGTKAAKKRKHSSPPDSIDSTSGLSFMESLSVGAVSHRSKKKKAKSTPPKHVAAKMLPDSLLPLSLQPSANFSKEIISSLSEEVDRPDIVHRSTKITVSDEFDAEDGDLKFKSKKVLWVPKTLRSNHSLGGASSGLSDSLNDEPTVPSLVELCLNVIEHNLCRVDHVGQVPYELLARPLSHASPEDLARIERCNPQFLGYSDDLWQRHIQRTFQGLKDAHPRPNESWCAYYERLSREESNRLNRIINQSARKIKQEQENRRTTLTTEVITPRQIQRRVARQHGSQSTQSKLHPHRSLNDSSSTSATVAPTFRPYNVSRPSSETSVARDHSAPSSLHATASSGGSGSGGNLLDKLRKQFRSGRLR